MQDYLWIFPVALMTGAAGYFVYAIATRGWRGAMFGHKIFATAPAVIEYQHGGAKFTIRIHKLDKDGLYGIEIGNWAMCFAETVPIIIPREQLLNLRDAIADFVDCDADSQATETWPLT